MTIDIKLLQKYIGLIEEGNQHLEATFEAFGKWQLEQLKR